MIDPISRQSVYAATLTTKKDTSVGLFAFVDYDRDTPRIDVPLYNGIPDEVLSAQYYANATFFGEVDHERFAALATVDEYEVGRLMAFLNHQVIGGI